MKLRKTLNERIEEMDEMIEDMLDGKIQVSQVKAAATIRGVQVRAFALVHDAAKEQNMLDQLNGFYNLEDKTSK